MVSNILWVFIYIYIFSFLISQMFDFCPFLTSIWMFKMDVNKAFQTWTDILSQNAKKKKKVNLL